MTKKKTSDAESKSEEKQSVQIFGPLTRKKNHNRIMLYYFAALVFLVIGVWKQNAVYYGAAGVFLILALIRKFVIMPKLRE